MDYTKNYHLPQWIESDRVRMEDFNNAMASIDAGISAARDAANQSGEEAGSLTAGIRTALTRNAYNRCVQLLAMGGLPRLEGAFVQKLKASQTPDNAEGLEYHPNGLWCACTPSAMSVDFIQSTMSATQLVMVKGNPDACTPMVISLMPSGPVRINYVKLKGTFNDNDGLEGRFRVTVEESGVSEPVQVEESGGGLSGKTSGTELKILLSAYLSGGKTYTITIQPLRAGFSGTFTYQKGDVMGISTYNKSSGGATGSLYHRFYTSDSAMGAVVVARYSQHGSNVSMNAIRGSEALAGTETVNWLDGSGQEIIERVFRFITPFSPSETVQLSVSVGDGCDVVLREWCVTLL